MTEGDKHSFISFLHDYCYKDLNNSAEKKSGYIDMKGLFFENFRGEDRQKIYDGALSLNDGPEVEVYLG
ncbi:hypothetical protein ACR9PT_08920 [Piscirickettsia salmonis]|uniref:hypothetical protein n=1 Tax=Piscirickettsia salmonis TaxID=1238 RepID=UPI003EB88304